MILKGTSTIDPINIKMKTKQLCKIFCGDKLVWKRTPDELKGYVMYYVHDSIGSDRAMNNTTVSLLDKDKTLIDSTTINNTTGYFEFDNRSDLHKTRYIKIATTIPHGGISSSDALAISIKANEDPISYWFPEWFLDRVGDVDGDGSITTDDAIDVSNRNLYPTDPDYYFRDPDDNLLDWVFGVMYDSTDDESNGRLFKYDSANSGIVDYRKESELYIIARCYGDILGNYNYPT